MTKISAKDISISVSNRVIGVRKNFNFIAALQVVLWWDISIMLLFLNSPCSYSIEQSIYL